MDVLFIRIYNHRKKNRIVKNTLLQTAFWAILPIGYAPHT